MRLADCSQAGHEVLWRVWAEELVSGRGEDKLWDGHSISVGPGINDCGQLQKVGSVQQPHQVLPNVVLQGK